MIHISKCVTKLRTFSTHSRILRRIVLKNDWLETPLTIEYPSRSQETELVSQELQRSLFSKSLQSQGDDFRDTVKDMLEKDLAIGEKLVLSGQTVRYTHRIPKYCRGYDLFKHEFQNKAVSKRYWNTLTMEAKDSFSDSQRALDLYIERLRIWKGYEIVEHLKRNLSKYGYNPYPLLGLYPWEIVKDKLRNKNELDLFEIDYYDDIIKEAFSLKNNRRSAFAIFSTNLNHEMPELKAGLKKRKKLFSQLDEKRLADLLKQQVRREEHARKLREKHKVPSPFLKYLADFHRKHKSHAFDGHSSNYSRQENILLNQQAAVKWRTMGTQEKRLYSGLGSNISNTRLYKEDILDWKLGIVLDYIYRVCGVVGNQNNFDWRTHMLEVTRGKRYISRTYVNQLLYIRNGEVFFS